MRLRIAMMRLIRMVSGFGVVFVIGTGSEGGLSIADVGTVQVDPGQVRRMSVNTTYQVLLQAEVSDEDVGLSDVGRTKTR